MRFPQTPPDWMASIKAAADQGKLNDLLTLCRTEGVNPKRYFHWDEFRHRVPTKDGFSPELQWAALRMNRSLKAQSIAMCDKKGIPFSFFLTQQTFERLHEIDLHCGGGFSAGGQGILDPETRDRYYVSSLIEEALTSSQLEGAVVTRSEARDMVRRNRQPSNPHERMVLNNYLTMRLLSKLKDEPLTPELVKTIHRRVSEGTLDDPANEGRFRSRSDDVRIEDDESGEIFHTPPAADELDERMEQMCAFANEQGMNGFLHPVIRSIILHFWVAYDHPFVDGNGRTARALFYWSMLRHGFWLAEFFSISHEILKAPKQYYRAFLHTETDGNDLNYFILHQLNTVHASINSLRDYIQKKQQETETLRQSLKPGGHFNHRQLALLRHAMKHPYACYTVVSHQTSHAVANQTAKTDLDALYSAGLLTRAKSGKAFEYRPIKDISEKLLS